jgi:hypothetical protein
LLSFIIDRLNCPSPIRIEPTVRWQQYSNLRQRAPGNPQVSTILGT